MHGDHLIFKFQGVDTISDAEKLAGAEVSIPPGKAVRFKPGKELQTLQ